MYFLPRSKWMVDNTLIFEDFVLPVVQKKFCLTSPVNPLPKNSDNICMNLLNEYKLFINLLKSSAEILYTAKYLQYSRNRYL